MVTQNDDIVACLWEFISWSLEGGFLLLFFGGGLTISWRETKFLSQLKLLTQYSYSFIYYVCSLCQRRLGSIWCFPISIKKKISIQRYDLPRLLRTATVCKLTSTHWYTHVHKCIYKTILLNIWAWNKLLFLCSSSKKEMELSFFCHGTHPLEPPEIILVPSLLAFQ